ncbi:TRAP transporter substrate-binding protein [Alcaligenes endophyticus]|uniref:TRAP transporter substrate-binding protein n=1 Tax=Alcaligenes endophyticus TaxID=1929088 RepID=A0ABT8EFT1_9BURK|nr:TRAP transporter substrate-binding protein [Alcaligenes endophyticus]MCX5590166.1 TRAP transporter substrate-binding protein [Alcaligenes endophyticus]MDN4120171.1 TRAP transporter substrate-binding protein [Alcaligenes endophyticus]
MTASSYKIRTFTCISALALTIGLQATANAADKPVRLRLSHNLPTTNALHSGVMVPWAKSIEQASEGSLKVQVFPAQQLGPAKDHYNMARDGIVDMAFYLVGIEPGRFPIVSAAEIPFSVSDNGKGSRALYEWYQNYADQEMGDVKVCTMFYDGGGTIHSKKKIESPTDMAGLKIRSPNVQAANFYRLAGASPIQLSASDAADAVERGVVDAISFPWNLLSALGADRALKYHLDMNFYSLGTAIVMNKNSYARLSDQQKAVIDSHCNADWAERLPKAWYDWEQEGRQALMTKSDHTLYTVPSEKEAEWKAMAEQVRAEWQATVDKTGADGQAIYADLQKRLDAYNAGY